MKITIAGTGYVGLSNAILLPQKCMVTALDIDPAKVALINNRKSPIVDYDIEEYLKTKDLNLHATLDKLRPITKRTMSLSQRQQTMIRQQIISTQVQ